MYSQNEEEIHIINYFEGFKGRFLDIGAYDGKTFSNTYRLYELGWEGVLIEPDEEAWAGLTELYKGVDTVKLVKAALAPTDGSIQFYTSHGGAVSTTNSDHRKKWERYGHCKFDPITVEAISIKTITSRYWPTYDFINLDVEGTNIELLKTLPLDQLQPKLISVEYDHRLQEAIDYCGKFGLTKVIYTSAENVIIGLENWKHV